VPSVTATYVGPDRAAGRESLSVHRRQARGCLLVHRRHRVGVHPVGIGARLRHRLCLQQLRKPQDVRADAAGSGRGDGGQFGVERDRFQVAGAAGPMMAKRTLGTVAIFAGLVLAWQLLHWIGGETALASPSATAVKLAALLRSDMFWGHVAETAKAFAFALV